jgi:N-acetylmuramoyl-L-alanine amidase
MRTPLRLSRFQPVRIFSVTGTSTARTTAAQMRATSSSFCSRAEPEYTLHTFFAGTAHVDVDDLARHDRRCSARLRPTSDRVVTGDLHTRSAIGFAGMIACGSSDLRVCHRRRIGRWSFPRHGQARTQPLAQLAKRLVGDAGHGGQDHGRINALLADQHGAHCSGPA